MKDTILVAGSRDFRDFELVHREVEMWAKELFLMAKHPPAMVSSFAPRVVHGGCPTGADRIATSAANLLGFELKVYPVDHALDGPWPAAGPRRNQRMLELEEERIGIVLAFTSALDGQLTRGTADCVRRALAMKLPVRSNSKPFHAVNVEVRRVHEERAAEFYVNDQYVEKIEDASGVVEFNVHSTEPALLDRTALKPVS